MKASIISALGVVALASAQSQYSTSTVSVYTTYTVTSCAATVTDCPARKGSVTTEYVSEYTTICPVTATEKSSAPYPTTTAAASGTETLLTTEVITISSCAPTVTDCPYTTKPLITTSIYPCPTTTGAPSGIVSSPPYVSMTSSPAGVISSAPVVPASSAPVSPASSPAPVISVITISTCVPSYYTSVITVTPTSVAPKSTYSAAPTGSIPGSGSNSTIPFTGAASGLKVGGAVMAMGLVAALL